MQVQKCSLKGSCLINNVIYKATVRKEEINNYDEKIFIGATELNWKNRGFNYNFSFTNRKFANSTTSSKHLW